MQRANGTQGLDAIPISEERTDTVIYAAAAGCEPSGAIDQLREGENDWQLGFEQFPANGVSPFLQTASKRGIKGAHAKSRIPTHQKEMSRLTKEEWREYTKTVWQIPNTVHPEHPAVFPAEIPHRLIKLFTFWGETVLDPFAGTGTTGAAALRLGRRAILVDQNPRYMEIAQRELRSLVTDETQLVAATADSRDLGWISDGSVAIAITSPPYWNKADYGSGSNNLGNLQGYLEFLEALRPTFEEVFRVLMPGRKVCIVTANVNQYTDVGLLSFPLAADLVPILRDIGFVMVNEVIWNKDGTGGRWGSWGAQRPIFGSYPYPPNFLFKTVHEYILIFAKPSQEKKRGPKVVPLGAIMRPAGARRNAQSTRPVPPSVMGATNGHICASPNGKEHPPAP